MSVHGRKMREMRPYNKLAKHTPNQLRWKGGTFQLHFAASPTHDKHMVQLKIWIVITVVLLITPSKMRKRLPVSSPKMRKMTSSPEASIQTLFTRNPNHWKREIGKGNDIQKAAIQILIRTVGKDCIVMQTLKSYATITMMTMFMFYQKPTMVRQRIRVPVKKQKSAIFIFPRAITSTSMIWEESSMTQRTLFTLDQRMKCIGNIWPMGIIGMYGSWKIIHRSGLPVIQRKKTKNNKNMASWTRSELPKWSPKPIDLQPLKHSK
mmetsp:Transcript_26461/g.45987  ORF Transcript_26461/g.45987 Transcript_26461/m.45987 type:complete len:264 (-) Transcript_26461:985-1776(-)